MLHFLGFLLSRANLLPGGICLAFNKFDAGIWAAGLAKWVWGI